MASTPWCFSQKIQNRVTVRTHPKPQPAYSYGIQERMVGVYMWLKILCTGILATVGIATPVHAVSSVGRVTLAIGAGTLSSVGGGPEPLAAGAEIRPGDRVTTGAGGHVHIRFVDGGLVSVRPHSNLTIEDYDYRADLPALSKVRFQLKEGMVRSISGAAAEAAKQRFRLNTPLVAIGVRGTDFVAQSTGVQSTATVNQGAIVVAPFGDGCSFQGVGPCGGASAVLVTPDMTGLLAEYRAGQALALLRQLTPAERARPGTSLASAQGVGSAERGNGSGLLGGNALASSAPTNPLQSIQLPYLRVCPASICLLFHRPCVGSLGRSGVCTRLFHGLPVSPRRPGSSCCQQYACALPRHRPGSTSSQWCGRFHPYPKLRPIQIRQSPAQRCHRQWRAAQHQLWS